MSTHTNDYFSASSGMVSETSSEVSSINSSQRVSFSKASIAAPVPCSDLHSTKSNDASRKLSISRTLTNRLNDIKKAVDDDNLQTEENSADINKILESRFDVADAIRLQHNESVQSKLNIPVTHTTTAGASLSAPSSSASSASSIQNDTTEHKASMDSKLMRNRLYPASTKHSGKDLEAQGITEFEPDEPTVKRVFTNKSTGQLELPPDGGYGWVVTFCVFLTMFSTWGCNASFGVDLAYYLNHDTYPGASKYDYALIAGLTVFLGQLLSPLVMALMRIIGLRTTMLFGDVVMLAAYLLASFTTKLWQLYVTQGFMVGCSISLIFVPATTVLPGWFLKKRAVAMGVSLLGTGAGGVVYGLATNKMLSDFGNTRWCLRIIGISCSISVLVAIALLKERNPTPAIGLRSPRAMFEQLKAMFSLKVITKPFVVLIALWFMFALFAYNMMVFTLSSYAISKGLSSHDASTLTAILNGSQSIGRPLMGLAGDKFGRANVTIVLTTLLTIYMFAFWIPAHTFVQLIFFSILVGSCVGVANVMNTVLIADMVKPEEFLPAWAFVNYCGAPFLLVCEVIAQALTVEKDKSNPYLHAQIFCGCCFIAALILISILREYSIRMKLTERQAMTNEKLKEWKASEYDTDSADEDWGKLKERKTKYDLLLGPGIKKYFLRMVYPMKV
ncbi:Esbp6p [Saccharomyces cerevisiae YJM1355]|nr:Esbp6p [Saccharomyces cerevisiae YJM1355]